MVFRVSIRDLKDDLFFTRLHCIYENVVRCNRSRVLLWDSVEARCHPVFKNVPFMKEIYIPFSQNGNLYCTWDSAEKNRFDVLSDFTSVACWFTAGMILHRGSTCPDSIIAESHHVKTLTVMSRLKNVYSSRTLAYQYKLRIQIFVNTLPVYLRHRNDFCLNFEEKLIVVLMFLPRKF